MKKITFPNNLLMVAAILFSLVCFTSCNKNDDVPPLFPSGTVTLNMQNEANGRTSIEGTSVYINKANNFFSRNEYIFDEGVASGIGREREGDIKNLVGELGVIPGHVYQIYNSLHMTRFPSGNWAGTSQMSYVRLYVDSFIKDKNDVSIGAVVKYISLVMPNKPDVILGDAHIQFHPDRSVSYAYQLPKGAECMWANFLNAHFDINIEGNTLKIQRKPLVYEKGSFGIKVREGNVYYNVIIENK